MKKTSLFAAALALALAPLTLSAQEATTIPQGFVKITLPEGPSSTYMGVPIPATPAFSGKAASVTNNTITADGTTPFQGTDYATAAAPYFVRITSGDQTGRMLLITSNTDSVLTVDITDNTSDSTSLTTSGFDVETDDTFDIVAGDTLATLFGTGPDLLLVGGTIGFFADTVGFYDGTRWNAYYYNTTQDNWTNLTGSEGDQDNRILYPGEGFIVARRSGRPVLDLTFMGRVPNVSRLTKLQGANKVSMSSVQFPVDVTLGELDFTGPGGWVENNVSFFADTIGLWNGTRFIAYWKNASGTWVQQGDQTMSDQSGLVIPAGTLIAVNKRAAVTGEDSFYTQTLPYNLD